MITVNLHVNAELQAQVTIWNDNTGTNARGNYQYKVEVEGEKGRVRTGTIKGHRRAHPFGAIQLLRRLLQKEFPFVPEHKCLPNPR